MFKREIKENFKGIDKSCRNINKELTNIKVAIHTLEKLGIETKELENIMTNLGIEFYKLRNKNHDKFKENLLNEFLEKLIN